MLDACHPAREIWKAPPALLFRMFSTLNQSLGKPQLVTWLQALSLLVKIPLTIWFVFGGLGLPVPGHTWQDEKNWGYRSFTSPETLTTAYLDLLAKLRRLGLRDVLINRGDGYLLDPGVPVTWAADPAR